MIKNILKVAFSGGILVWLIAQDKVNFDIILEIANSSCAFSRNLLHYPSKLFKFLPIFTNY